jgi:hypothetical protein
MWRQYQSDDRGKKAAHFKSIRSHLALAFADHLDFRGAWGIAFAGMVRRRNISMDDAQPGLRPERLIRLMQAAIRGCELDLSDTVVFTEAATGAYVVTPVLAALAGARVFALARETRHGSVGEVTRATLELARAAAVAESIEIVTAKRADHAGQADIITNSGHVRPIDAEMIAAMKPTAVIPLMFEAWEFRAGDLDLPACRRHGIPVAGTNESHPAVDVTAFLGLMAARLLMEAGIAVPRSRLVLCCDNRFGPFLSRQLMQAGASVTSVDRLESGIEAAGTDAVVIALRPRSEPVVASREADIIRRRYPDAVVAQFLGDLDRDALTAARVPFWPPAAPAPGHQGVRLSDLGPEPIVLLQCGGLKVGEVMARVRRSRSVGHAGCDDAIAAAVASGFGQALPSDAGM